jgi:hypothetical protein
MSPDFLEALVALREEVARDMTVRDIACCLTCSFLQHTRRLAAIEGQYYGGSTFGGNENSAGAADEESQPMAAVSRAHSGGSANEASSGRPVSTSAAGRKADGLVRVCELQCPFVL